ncbi:MAG: FGGY-family carbohydrate kinase [Thermoprotei archaeon]
MVVQSVIHTMNIVGDDLFLGVDLGTSSCKVVLVNSMGNIVASSVNTYPLYISSGGGAEQNPEDWWVAVVKGIRDVISVVGSTKIRCVGVTGQWSGTVAVDSDGRPLAPAIIWMDTRGERVIREISGGFPSVSGYRLDKLVRWLRLTGGAPAHSGKDSLAHILYMKRFMPDVYRKTYKFLEPKDFIVFRLTGRMAASWDNVALLWSTDNRNPVKVSYDEKLIEMNSIDGSKLPELVSPVSIVGNLSGEASRVTGLPSDSSVIAGCGDMQCSLIGVGAIEDYVLHVYLGTSSWVTAHVPFKKTDIFHSIASLPSAIPGKYFIAAEQENACNCLEYVCRILTIEGEDKYNIVDRECNSSAPGANGLMFLPWLFGERAPVEDPFLRGGFFNMGLNHTRGDVLRSVMEGVAMNSKWLLSIVEGFMGRKSEEVLVAGGGATSSRWTQIYADVLDRRVVVVDNPRYSTVRGAALLSAVGSGLLKFQDLKVLREGAKVFEADKRNSELYERLFKHFTTYYKRNADLMHELNMGR